MNLFRKTKKVNVIVSNYFKSQKQAQANVENYFVPASIETIQRLHSDAVGILIRVKYKQELIEATKLYIEKTKIESSKQEQLINLARLLEEKQMLLTSYRKLMVEVNKQSGII